jgi:hypothetical protein
MSGTRDRFRYLFRTQFGGVTNRVGFVDADSDITTLTFRSVANVQPATSLPTNTFSIQFPIRAGNKGRLIRARVVLIRLTQANDQNAVGRRAWIPVLSPVTFELWQAGDAGSWKGLSCVLVRKVDGCPDIGGQFG